MRSITRANQPPCGRGITLIEVLVAIAIIGILLALILPAVQAARATARKTDCGNQLHQIAMACESYTTVVGRYPSRQGSWSYHVRPYLAIPFEQKAVLLYTCPSDREHAVGDDHFHISYALNNGFGYADQNGLVPVPFEGKYEVRPADVIDGLSTTAMFAERLANPWFAPLNVDMGDHPELWNRTLRQIYVDHQDLDAFYQECRDNAGPPAYIWYLSSFYEHLMPPNHNSCFLYPSEENPYPRPFHVITAGSLHRGGTHAVFCDTHLSFVNDEVDIVVWRALGSRNGGEPYANPF